MACFNELVEILKSLLPDDVYVIVGTANSDVEGGIVNAGQQSFTIPTHAGWKTRLQRGGFGQPLGDPGTGETFFEYASITGEYTLSLKTQVGDVFICQAYKPA